MPCFTMAFVAACATRVRNGADMVIVLDQNVQYAACTCTAKIVVSYVAP